MSFLKRYKENLEAYKKTDAYEANHYQHKIKQKLMLVLFPVGALPLWIAYKYLGWENPKIFYVLIPFCIIGANYGAYRLRRKKFKD